MKRFPFFMAVIVMLLPAFAPSCNRDDNVLISEMDSQVMDYLDVSTLDPDLFTTHDSIAFFKAISRVGFHVENGLIVAKYHSAQEACMSESLYEFLMSLVCKTNTTKAGPPSDCVAQSLALWGEVSYSTINSYIEGLYGNNGVPETDIYDVIKHFYPSAQQHYPDTAALSFEPSIMTTVGYYATGNNNAHMVNIDDISDNGMVTFYDAQANSIDSCNVFQFSRFFTKN